VPGVLPRGTVVHYHGVSIDVGAVVRVVADAPEDGADVVIVSLGGVVLWTRLHPVHAYEVVPKVGAATVVEAVGVVGRSKIEYTS